MRDRRSAVRLPAAFDVELSDHYYRWEASGRDLSPDGCGVKLAADFAAGKELEAHLPPAWGAPPLDVRATVAHLTRGIVGLRFDVSRRETYEAMLDRVDRLTVQKPELGVYAAQAVRRLEPRVVLTAASALAAVAVTEPERRFLKQLGSQRTLDEVARGLGAEWADMRHVPFALLHRGLIRLGGRSQPPPPPSGAPPPVAVANVRPAQADRYVQNAVAMIDSGDRRQARLNLRLAAALSPNDAEIESLLAQVAEEKK
ncbi:MAG: PilZ domain-containing protein [Myxococcales bacterium]